MRHQQLLFSLYQWTFSLDGVVVEPGHTYMVSIFNFPQAKIRHDMINKEITIPGELPPDPDVERSRNIISYF